jgi:tetratricopeptide (TPR) repeat protein
MHYQFFGFDPKSFQGFATTLAGFVFGPGVIAFGDGPDLGRDAIFDGAVPFPFPPEECWNGYGVVQAKCKANPEGASKDQKWALNNLKTELELFVSSPDRVPKPQYYVFVTNVDLAAAGKGWDEAERLLKSYYGKLPLRGHAIWGASQLTMLVDRFPKIRETLIDIGRAAKPDTCFVEPPIPPRTDAEFVGPDADLAELKLRLGIPPELPADGGDLAAGNDQYRANTGRRLVVMKGIPGVGKSTLACQLALERKDVPRAFPDGVLWASLGPHPDFGRHGQIADWVQEVGKFVGKTFDYWERGQPGDYRKHAKSFLRRHLLHLRVLIVIDDAWRTDDAREFDVGGKGCATLFTTRLDNVARDLVSDVRNSVYELKVLGHEDGKRLFAKLAPYVADAHPVESEELVTELNGLPLALQVAGRLLQAKSHILDVGKFIKDLRAQRNQPLVYENLPDNMKELVKASHYGDLRTVSALLELSMQQLSERARVGFVYLGALAPKPAFFRKAFVAGLFAETEGTGMREQASPSLDAERVLEELCDVGLVEYSTEPVDDKRRSWSNRSRYGLHSLLAAFALSRASGQDGVPSLHQVLLLHCEYCLRIVRELAGLTEKGDFDAALDELAQSWPNIVLAQNQSASRGGLDERWARCSTAFGRSMTTYLQFWLRDQVGTTWARSAVDAARFLKDPEELAWLLAGFAAIEGGEKARGGDSTGAIEHFGESASLFGVAGNRHGESYALAHLGHALLAAERYDEARECFQRALELVDRVGDPRCSVHVKCTCLTGLARLEMIKGDGDAARGYLTQVMSAAREQSCRGCEAAALAELGSLVFEKRSSIDEALEHTALTEERRAELERALGHARQAAELYRLAKSHGQESLMHNLMARLFAFLGEPEAFEIALREAERADHDRATHRNQIATGATEEHLAPDVIDVSTPSDRAKLRYLAHFIRFRGFLDREDATSALAAAEELWPAVQALDRPQFEAEFLGLKGRCFLRLGKLADAIDCFEKALPRARSIAKDDLEAELQGDLARAHRANGDAPAAFRAYEARAEVFHRLDDKYHEAESLIWLFQSLGNWHAPGEIVDRLKESDAPAPLVDCLVRILERLRDLGYPQNAAAMAVCLGTAIGRLAGSAADTGQRLSYGKGSIGVYKFSIDYYATSKEYTNVAAIVQNATQSCAAVLASLVELSDHAEAIYEFALGAVSFYFHVVNALHDHSEDEPLLVIRGVCWEEIAVLGLVAAGAGLDLGHDPQQLMIPIGFAKVGACEARKLFRRVGDDKAIARIEQQIRAIIDFLRALGLPDDSVDGLCSEI